MQKGHLVLAVVSLVLMIALPGVSVLGQPSSAVTPVTVSVPAEETLQVLRTGTQQVETVSMSDYLFGVVAAEMPMSYPPEAIKAQIVAAYTLTCNRIAQRKSHPPEELKGADMTDSSATDQSYISLEAARTKWGEKADAYQTVLEDCIGQVFGEMLVYNGQPAVTVYHAVSAGRTESAANVWGGEYPYLIPVESVGDLVSDQYLSQVTLTKAELVDALAKADLPAGELTAEETVGNWERTESGMVLTVELMGQQVTGSQLRKALSLASANFDVRQEGDSLTFTTYGYGHLVGMSQFGAMTMAQQGSTYREILLWYYPGCVLKEAGT